jgi:hypothetical protein
VETTVISTTCREPTNVPLPPFWRLLGISLLVRLSFCLTRPDWPPSLRLPLLQSPHTYIWSLSPGSTLESWRWRQDASPKRWLLPTKPHGNSTQKNTIRIVTTEKNLNLTSDIHTLKSCISKMILEMNAERLVINNSTGKPNKARKLQSGEPLFGLDPQLWITRTVNIVFHSHINSWCKQQKHAFQGIRFEGSQNVESSLRHATGDNVSRWNQ